MAKQVKSMKKWTGILLVCCLLLTLIPVSSAEAAESSGESAFSCEYQAVGNTGAVITVSSDQEITAEVDDSDAASVTVEDSQITVTASGELSGQQIVTVTVKGDGVTLGEIEVPLGYTTFVFDEDQIEVFEGDDTNYDITGINTDGTEYEDLTGTSDEESGGTVYENTDDYSLLVNIKKKGGSYVFTGTGDDMAIAVNKEATKPAVLLLAGLTLTSSLTAPITVKKDSSSTVTITALKGHSNSLSDAALNNADVYGSTDDGGDGTNEEYAESAVIKCKSKANVTLNGSGTLALNCASKNAIKAGEYGTLTIEDLTLDITSVNHGISSDNTMAIASGTISVTAEGDGIRSNPDAVDADAGCTGTITISGGTLDITAGSDGIQAAQDLIITDGSFTIVTGAGYDDADFDGDTMSCKGLKASSSSDESEDTSESSNTIEISGGTFTLNTADDAIHSDGYIVITAGTFQIQTGDDGIHADTSLTLGTEGSEDDSLPAISVWNSYEGLEAGTVYLYSGTYKVVASDDGINAAGGSDSSEGTNGGMDNFNSGGGPGGFSNQPGSSTSSSTSDSDTEDYSINISGGYVWVNSEGDGLDSNGDLNISGGTVVTWGCAAGGSDEPLDCDGDLLISGGTVFGAGSGSMTTTPASKSQAYVTSSSTIAEGKTINVQNSGSTVFYRIALKNVNYVIYSSSDMTSSTGWSISADSSATTDADSEDESTEASETTESTEAAASESTEAAVSESTEAAASESTEAAVTSTEAAASESTEAASVNPPKSGTTLTDSAANAQYIVIKAGATVSYAGTTDQTATSVKIPSSVTIEGVTYSVTAIADGAFKGNKKLVNVTIPSSVTVIGNSAFQGCTALKKIVIPKKVEEIGKKAFYNCRSLKNITIKTKKLTSISVGKKAFTKAGSSNYKKLKVKVPSGKKSLYKKILKKKGLKVSSIV